MSGLRKASSFLVGLCFLTATQARSAEPAAATAVTIITGSPAFISRIAPKRAEIEKLAGLPLDIKVAPTHTGVKALCSGMVDALSVGTTADDAWEIAKASGVKVDSLDLYDFAEIGKVTIKVALHPDNPVKSLTRQQVTDILSGKIKNWETINGNKIPIRVFLAKNYVAATKSVLAHYMDGQASPVAELVVDKDGVLKALQQNPGGLSFFTFREETSGFKPKFIDSDGSHPSVFIIRKNASAPTRKVFDYLRSMAQGK